MPFEFHLFIEICLAGSVLKYWNVSLWCHKESLLSCVLLWRWEGLNIDPKFCEQAETLCCRFICIKSDTVSVGQIFTLWAWILSSFEVKFCGTLVLSTSFLVSGFLVESIDFKEVIWQEFSFIWFIEYHKLKSSESSCKPRKNETWFFCLLLPR